MTTNSAAGNAITKWIYSTSTGQLSDKKYNYIDANNPGSGPSYTYTDAGRLKTRTNTRNITATQYYDLGGQLLAVDYSDSTPDILYTTDCLGRILDEHQGTLTVANDTPSMATPARSVSYTFHPTLLKLQTETHSLGAETRSFVRAYDNIGRPEQTSVGIDSNTDPTTLETTEHFTAYHYGTDGRILGIDAQNVPRFTGKNYGIEYTWRANSLSLIDSITRKGTGTSADLKTYNLWDDYRDTLESKENKLDVLINPVSISKYTYIVNSIGQRDSVDTDGTAFGTKPEWSWGYNVRGELVSANDTTTNDQDLGYIYDSIGNRTATGSVYTVDDGIETVTNSLAYTPNILNQYSVAKGITLPTVPTPAPYDLDGNLRYDGGVNKDGQTREYMWDAENRLLEVKTTSEPAVTLVSYKYDARSRRISLTAGTMTTWYLYDGVNCIAEYTQEGSGSLTLSKTNVWGLDLSSTLQGAGGVGGLLAVTDEAGEDDPLYYPTFDGNGNVSEYLTAAGVTVAHYEYDPFGNDITPANDKGTMHDLFAYRFSTKPFDSITGWYYYLYRYYDPLTGRWPSRDPIEEGGGMNLYGFNFKAHPQNLWVD
jgi:RHS repeat-associated protein